MCAGILITQRAMLISSAMSAADLNFSGAVSAVLQKTIHLLLSTLFFTEGGYSAILVRSFATSLHMVSLPVLTVCYICAM